VKKKDIFKCSDFPFEHVLYHNSSRVSSDGHMHHTDVCNTKRIAKPSDTDANTTNAISVCPQSHSIQLIS